MKTILWATLSANGNYARPTPELPPKREALEDFASQVRAAGNFIVGRRTFEEFQSQPTRRADGPDSPFATADIIVVSRNATSLGPIAVPSPRAALERLAAKGHRTALVGGGEKLHNAFLAEDLVDELIMNVSPTLEDEGLKLLLPEGRMRGLTLLESKSLGGGVIQLRYGLR